MRLPIDHGNNVFSDALHGLRPKPICPIPHFLLWMILASLVFSLVMFFFFYLGARMQLVFFEIVLSRASFVAPIWNKYGPRTWSWIGLKLLTGLVFVLLFGFPVWRIMLRLQEFQLTPGAPLPPHFFQAFFSTFGVVFALFFIMMLVASLQGDFMLPCHVLEDTPLREAARRLSRLIATEPLEFIAYVFFKGLLAVAGALVAYIAAFIILVPVAIVLLISAAAGWFIIHIAAPDTHLPLIIGGVFLYLSFIVIEFYLLIGTIGIVITFLQAYATVFPRWPLPSAGQPARTAPTPGAGTTHLPTHHLGFICPTSRRNNRLSCP